MIHLYSKAKINWKEKEAFSIIRILSKAYLTV